MSIEYCCQGLTVPRKAYFPLVENCVVDNSSVFSRDRRNAMWELLIVLHIIIEAC